MSTTRAGSVDLSVELAGIRLANPVMTASGTSGFGPEYAPYVDLRMLGAFVTKAVTVKPRKGNPPPRTVETASGMLNAIGLDNDGIDHFLSHHVPYLRQLPTAVIANIAGKSEQEFIDMAGQIAQVEGLAGLELNLSCPNVSGGLDFATDPAVTHRIVEGVRRIMEKPPAGNPGWSGDAPDPTTSRAPHVVYNIGNSQPVELMRMIEVLENALGMKAEKMTAKSSARQMMEQAVQNPRA